MSFISFGIASISALLIDGVWHYSLLPASGVYTHYHYFDIIVLSEKVYIISSHHTIIHNTIYFQGIIYIKFSFYMQRWYFDRLPTASFFHQHAMFYFSTTKAIKLLLYMLREQSIYWYSRLLCSLSMVFIFIETVYYYFTLIIYTHWLKDNTGELPTVMPLSSPRRWFQYSFVEYSLSIFQNASTVIQTLISRRTSIIAKPSHHFRPI